MTSCAEPRKRYIEAARRICGIEIEGVTAE